MRDVIAGGRSAAGGSIGRLLVLAVLLATLGVMGGVGVASAGTTLAPAARPGSIASSGNLGTNLGAVNYYDGLVPFANLTDQAGDWVPQRVGAPWGTGQPLELRRDGWPARLGADQFGTLVLAEHRYPAGTYRVSWSGSGAFDINGTTFSSSSGTAGGAGTVALDGHTIALLNVRRTDPGDPLRAVRVMVPGEAPDAVFRSSYLRQLGPYRALRFMDWQRTNSTFAEPRRTFTCDTRVLPTSHSQGTSAGVSVERMVELANLLGVDPWFTIPHEASADWVRCHAKIVAGTLAPGLTARYEFSNETWNSIFRAFHELSAEGRALGLGGGDAFLGLQQRVGQRHAEVMAVVSAEFAAAGRPVVRVLAGQAANAWVVEQRLATAGARSATDEIAIAPYLGLPGVNPFDPAEAQRLAQLSQADVFSNLARAQTEEVDRWTADHLALAARTGMRLVAYEGGQHLAGNPNNAALTSLFTAANRATAMGDAYRTYLGRWRTATGNALFMHFSDVGPASKFGSWGALEFPEQGTSAKYAALADYAADPDPPSPEGAVFVPVAPARVADTRTAWGGAGPIPAGEAGMRTLSVASTQDGGAPVVPPGAVAIVCNITVPNPAHAGHVRVMPADGAGVTTTSAVNFRAGESIANAVTVRVSAARQIKVYAGVPTDVVVDVVGYFVPVLDQAGGRFTPTVPIRVYDTAADPVGPLGSGSDRLVSLAATQVGGTAVVPAGASAVAYNITVVRPTGPGHLRVMPGNVAQTAASALNWTASGDVIANGSTVKVDSQRRIRVVNAAGVPVRFLVDVVGFYSDTGVLFHACDPVRVLDTRPAEGGAGAIGPGVVHQRAVAVADSGTGESPVPAVAVAYNLTVTGTTVGGHLRVYPGGTPLVSASAINWPGAGFSRANGSIVSVGRGREVVVYNGSGAAVDAIIDVFGYYG